MMMIEHSFLWDIVADINAIWGEERQRKTWPELGEGNPYESQRKAIVRARLAQYRNAIAISTPAQLHLNAKLRASELEQLYQQAAAHLPDLDADGLPLFHENMVRTLWDLTIGYAAASVIAYYQKGIILNLPASIRAESKALATSAAAQGLTDADTFLGILNASTSTAGGRSQVQPQPRPKDAILNNSTAVSLLKMMQDAGLLDAAYQWIGTNNEGKHQRHTNYEKAQFAFYIAGRCYNKDNTPQIQEWDKSFCDFWGLPHRTLSKAYADLGTKSEKTQSRYHKMLAIFDTPAQ